MSTTNLGIIKSEANPLTGTKVQLNTGGWFIAESSAIPKSKVVDSIEVNIRHNGESTIRPVGDKEAFKEVVINTDVESDIDIQANKAVTITTNTVTEITPDDGKDGMAKVTVTTNIPVPTPPAWFTNGKDTVLWTRSGGIVSDIYFLLIQTNVLVEGTDLQNAIFCYGANQTYSGNWDANYFETVADGYTPPKDAITISDWFYTEDYDGAASELETCSFIGSFTNSNGHTYAVLLGTI